MCVCVRGRGGGGGDREEIVGLQTSKNARENVLENGVFPVAAGFNDCRFKQCYLVTVIRAYISTSRKIANLSRC